ncbi:hypothetical protein RJT34_31264 [Clitoria ternatea]|uniref:Uncharacterized protein n=1 Tax=Clitoria ternatea TaxID=43366 RepID=A0AAN9EYB0_CLITE
MDKQIPSVDLAMSSDEVSFADTVFSFWDDVKALPENSSKNDDDDDDIDDNNNNKIFDITENNKAFWEEQDELLKATLCRSSTREAKIRQATKEALMDLKMSEMVCICRRRPVVAKSCTNCLLRELCDQLMNLGYNSAICKSKWRSSSEIPSGEHTYLEVTDNSSNAKRGIVKVVIELNFRAEFEMARANEEYKQLIKRLPEVFVGKIERLRALVKIMCSAAKKCMKEKNMHLGPWRKHKYMQAKWLGSYDRSTLEPLPILYSTRPPKPKASMLTCDLLDNIPGMRCTTVEVV